MRKATVNVGDRFGRLVTIESKKMRSSNQRTFSIWLCECDCGNRKWIYQSNLKSGGTVSCGCYRAENSKRQVSPIKKDQPRLYSIYETMKQRCNNRPLIIISQYK